MNWAELWFFAFGYCGDSYRRSRYAGVISCSIHILEMAAATWFILNNNVRIRWQVPRQWASDYSYPNRCARRMNRSLTKVLLEFRQVCSRPPLCHRSLVKEIESRKQRCYSMQLPRVDRSGLWNAWAQASNVDSEWMEHAKSEILRVNRSVGRGEPGIWMSCWPSKYLSI